MYFNPERSSSNLVLEASSDGAFTATHMIYSDASQIFYDKITVIFLTAVHAHYLMENRLFPPS